MQPSGVVVAGPALVEALDRRVEPAVAFDAFSALPHAFFLDSGLRMPGLTRHSILGCRPFRVMESTDRRILLRDRLGAREIEGDPFRELRRLLPYVEQGGFIPGVDHRVQADVPLKNYLHYLDRKRELFNVGGVPKY